MKKIAIILITLFSVALVSCKKNCVNCHQIKLYDGAERGVFDIIAVEEACGYFEQRKFTKQSNGGEDGGGEYEIFWECDLYPESDITPSENQ